MGTEEEDRLWTLVAEEQRLGETGHQQSLRSSWQKYILVTKKRKSIETVPGALCFCFHLKILGVPCLTYPIGKNDRRLINRLQTPYK